MLLDTGLCIPANMLPPSRALLTRALTIDFCHPSQVFNRMIDSFSDGAPVRVPFSLIKQWTENFKNVIGKGAFCTVYSGIVLVPEEREKNNLVRGRRVAVKRIDAKGILASIATDAEGGNVELLHSIRNEVNLMSSLRHPNIARLVGHCLPPSKRLVISEQMMTELCLIYELAPKGGLGKCLRDYAESSDLLWQYRLKIAAGVAKGLCHMHNNIPGSPVFHRDMKSSNIVLMTSYDPKIINCSLSEYASAPSSTSTSVLSHTDNRLGTPVYACPLYRTSAGMAYDSKCEVFSFGILLLELLTGKLQCHVGKDGKQLMLDCLLSRGKLVADHRIHWPEGLVADISALAAQCTASRDERIDSMSAVIGILDSTNVKYHELGLIDDDFLRVNRGLTARLESLQLQQDIRVMDLETTYKCEICFEDNIPASKGVTCNNRAHPHFFCGAERNDCFSDLVSFQSSHLGSFARNSYGIVCGCCTALVPKVVTSFDASAIGRHSSDSALEAFINANTNAGRCEGQRALEDQRLKYMGEIQRLKEAAMADAARLAASSERHRLRIMDKIVTLHCPHCNVAILDFNGCFAVHHEADHADLRQGCGQYFCGWCLAKFSNNEDCHVHVKICPHNLHPGTYFGEFPADFNRVHGARRRNQVLQYLRSNIPDEKERDETAKAIRADLLDLEIHI
jgi:serine/threonine protein kinase